jgi:hypothetical protein
MNRPVIEINRYNIAKSAQSLIARTGSDSRPNASAEIFCISYFRANHVENQGVERAGNNVAGCFNQPAETSNSYFK